MNGSVPRGRCRVPGDGRGVRRGAGRARRDGGVRDERGAGSVLALAMIGLLVCTTGLAGAAVAVVATHRTAQAAADLAALAGAGALQQGRAPCERAGEVAGRNRTRLVTCRVVGDRVGVEVVADTARLPGGLLDLRGRAWAGPAGTRLR